MTQQANVPVPTVLFDAGGTAQIKVTGLYLSAQTAANTVVLTANTLKGANANFVCICHVVDVQFCTGMANGWIALEYVNSNGANQTIVTMGRTSGGGILSGWMANKLGANATGDIQVRTSALDANDTYDLIFSVQKDSVTPNTGFTTYLDSAYGKPGSGN